MPDIKNIDLVPKKEYTSLPGYGSLFGTGHLEVVEEYYDETNYYGKCNKKKVL